MDRRTFNKTALLAAADLLLASCSRSNEVEVPEKIIVIGAGMAGLSAARRLHDAGHDVTILEGRDRIGGRIWTSTEWEGTWLDMGASWIHRVNGNPITKLADEASVERHTTDFDSAVLFDDDGTLMADRYWSRAEELFGQVEEIIETAAANGQDMTISDAITAQMDINALDALDQRLLNYMLAAEIHQDWAADSSQLAVRFEPPLPKSKLLAMDALGSGILNKVYLRFSEIFWHKNKHWLCYLNDEEGRFVTWFNVAEYSGEPVIMAFNAGLFGAASEALSDEEIVVEAMAVLRAMYGANIPEPEAAQITRWLSDPFAYGSYSYPAIGMTETTRAELASPVGTRLFFAGEATSSDYPATVHGAYLSGQREAERILDLA